MPTKSDNPKPAKLPEICCPKCHLYQLYPVNVHTKCIHCGSQLGVSHLRPKLVQKGV